MKRPQINVFILGMVTMLLIGTFFIDIPILPQNANATLGPYGPNWSGGGGEEAPVEDTLHQKSISHDNASHIDRHGGSNILGSHTNTTSLK